MKRSKLQDHHRSRICAMLKLFLSAVMLVFVTNVFAECGYTKSADGQLRYACTDDYKYPRYSAPKAGLSSHGYPCTVDCSGHEAGYTWAKRNGISDPSQCGGDSMSFVEGCRAAAIDILTGANERTLEELLMAPGESETRARLRTEADAARLKAAGGDYARSLRMEAGESLARGLFGAPVDPAVETAAKRDRFRAAMQELARTKNLNPATDPGAFYSEMSRVALEHGLLDIATMAADRASNAKLAKTEADLAQIERMRALEAEQAKAEKARLQAAAAVEEASSAKEELTLMGRLRELQKRQAAQRARAAAKPNIPALTSSKVREAEALIPKTLSMFAPHGTDNGKIVPTGHPRRNVSRDAYVTDVTSRALALQAEAKARGEILDFRDAVLQADKELSPKIDRRVVGVPK